MTYSISRRSFITSAAISAGAALLNRHGNPGMLFAETAAPSNATSLRATMRTLEINGKSASLMGIEQANGKQGLSLVVNQPFNALLENKLPVPTAIHWHGLHPPNRQDGVPGLTQPVIAPNASMHYDFPALPAGTHWMHSHEGLQEAFLLSAPLIVHDPANEPADEQQVILFLGDFSFTPPTEIFTNLRKAPAKPMSMGANMGQGKPGAKAGMAGMAMDKPDVNDVDYDAYLANDRTLADPEVVRVEKNGKVRLRIINGSSGTNFFISLGDLKGEVIATDGMPVKPFAGSYFPLAIAQRIDVRLRLPREGAFPILALREGAMEQTGFILATTGAPIKKLPAKNAAPAGLLNLDMESQLVAAAPLAAKPVDQTFDLRLGGNMSRYDWTINDIVFDVQNPRSEKPLVRVKQGQRVAMKFINQTMMSHPMHFHGHSFQVVDINGKQLNGPVRDTLLVTPKSSVTVLFDANNPGTWYVHCHVLWHLAAGMAALVEYEA